MNFKVYVQILQLVSVDFEGSKRSGIEEEAMMVPSATKGVQGGFQWRLTRVSEIASDASVGVCGSEEVFR